MKIFLIFYLVLKVKVTRLYIFERKILDTWKIFKTW